MIVGEVAIGLDELERLICCQACDRIGFENETGLKLSTKMIDLFHVGLLSALRFQRIQEIHHDFLKRINSRSGKVRPPRVISSHRRKGMSADPNKKPFWKPFHLTTCSSTSVFSLIVCRDIVGHLSSLQDNN
jgi:hypothetical protein